MLHEFLCITDAIDETTIQELERPRCSKPDDNAEGNRNKRFALLNQGRYLWGQSNSRRGTSSSRDTSMPVTVGFKNYWNGMSNSHQEWVAMECARVSFPILLGFELFVS